MNRVIVPGRSADRTTFLGYTVPREIKRIAKAFGSIPAEGQKSAAALLVSLSVQLINAPDQPPSHDLSALSYAVSLKLTTTRELLSGVLLLTKQALRLSSSQIKKQVFAEDLDYLEIPAVLRDEVIAVVFTDRAPAAAAQSSATLVDMQWRVDVAISTSTLKRSLQPSVMLQLTLSDGSVKTFEVSINKFHELRYNTAAMLKDMIEMEKRPALQI